MHNVENRFLKTVFRSSAIGGLALLAVVGGVLALDMLSISTMIGASAEPGIVSAVLIGGALTKGLAFGAAFGMAFATRRHSAPSKVFARQLGAVAS